VTEVSFYHCTRTKPDAALPKLLGRALAAGERCVVRCGDAARAAALDEALWACEEPDWLPHGASEDPDLQPIWLTERDENPNGARLLFLMDGATAGEAPFARVLDLFDGDDAAALEQARARWRAAQAAGLAPVYHRQGERGWERPAAPA
jgi:DNA polymerase-3 subunit chi